MHKDEDTNKTIIAEARRPLGKPLYGLPSCLFTYLLNEFGLGRCSCSHSFTLNNVYDNKECFRLWRACPQRFEISKYRYKTKCFWILATVTISLSKHVSTTMLIELTIPEENECASWAIGFHDVSVFWLLRAIGTKAISTTNYHKYNTILFNKTILDRNILIPTDLDLKKNQTKNLRCEM